MTGRALEHIEYHFDSFCALGIFRDLQRRRMVEGLEWQRLSRLTMVINVRNYRKCKSNRYVWNVYLDISSSSYYSRIASL